MINFIYILAGLVAGAFVSMVALKGRKFFDMEKDVKTAEELIRKAREDAEKIKNDTRTYAENRTETFKQEVNKRKERLTKLEEVLKHKEEFIVKKEERNQEIRLKIATNNEETNTTQSKIKNTEKEIVNKLSQKTGNSIEETRERNLKKHILELESENQVALAKTEEWLKENAEKKAKNLIINVIQRLCSPTSVETRSIHVVVPRDAVKGKIVGRDGQNIKEFERLLDVDVVFNDLPNTISISAFMLVKRRIAQKAMEKLVNFRGDITKNVVQRAVDSATKETDDELYEIGKKALEKMGIKHNDKEFARIVGRLQYRTSYGQNIMKHSMEVGWVASILGNELGLNVQTCKVSGFLHDLGKAIDQDPNVKDAHDYLSKEIMEKYGFSKEEVHAAWTHHDAIPQETPEALIVKAADAISASRPGARQESFDKYIERIRALEDTGYSFEGVKAAFALSAGRELRVIVDPEKINDKTMLPMAQKMAAKIEEELTYPGQIKVNIIRKTKYTEIAL